MNNSYNDIKKQSEEQYAELLKDLNIKKPKKKQGFVLGEKKDIYESNMTLDDILNKNK